MKYEKLVPDKRRKSDFSTYVKWGVTAFFVLAAVVLVVFLFVRAEAVSAFLGTIKSVLSPVLYGAVIAYLLNPIVCFFNDRLSHFMLKHAKKLTRARKVAKTLSVIIAMLIGLVIVGVLVYLIVPQLGSTITLIAEEMPDQVDNFLAWFNGLMQEQSKVGEILQSAVNTVTGYIENFIENDLLGQVSSVAEQLFNGVVGVVNVVYNLVIGLVFCIYILSSKEKFAAQAKKILFACMKRRKANTIIRTAKKCHRIFTGAISGKILDSAIVGVLCFVGMSIIGLPYAPLIAVIVGVTNVIPFFGPYIGAIPSAILILFVSPLQCLYFIIFIIVLQQIDCNILDPRIVGGSVGLSAFWVLFACILFGGLFGIQGMVLGVPTFACIYTIIKSIVERRLRNKGLMTETDEYAGVDALPEEEMILTLAEYEDYDAAKNHGEHDEKALSGVDAEGAETQDNDILK